MGIKASASRHAGPGEPQPAAATRGAAAAASASLAQSPRQTAQRQAIAAAFGPATASRHAGPPPVQAKIRVKGGATFSAMKDLPASVRTAEALRPAVESADNYLAKSEGDVVARGAGRPAPLLTPHRHLIGERHNASRFEDALKAWGWGADKMVEEFHHSADVVDKITQENMNLKKVGLFANPLYLAKPLENLHAKVIQTLSTVRFVLGQVQENSGKMSRIAGNIDQKPSKDVMSANKESFELGATMLENQRSLALSEWNGGIEPHLSSYEDACTNRLKTARGEGSGGPALLHDLATAMQGKWGKLAKNIKVLTTKPYGLTDSWAETAQALATCESNIDDFIKHGIDRWADGLVALTKAEAASISGDDTHNDTVDTGWQNAKTAQGSKNALLAIGPMREIFMAHNINTKLEKPGLVQIGELHVDNLAGKIADGKYHKTYDAFEADASK
jgi:hypothetical protein